jgi:tRNA threonylcarbamoyladenosine dehydratase
MDDFTTRFGGIARLYGRGGLERLRRAHVAVVGIGGVGTWVVEALARSGVGTLTLIDLDDVCVTNVNRQLHALENTIGRSKVEAMAERVRAIHPQASVHAVGDFFTAANAPRLLETRFDCVVDAIDTVPNKCLLIAHCHGRGLPVITSGGAGGRRDPTQVRVADLAQTTHDRLLQKVRDTLRREYGFPRGEKKFGVPAVFSPESPMFPQSDGTVCGTKEPGSELQLDCESGYGTASFVTGTFGFAMAAWVVRQLAARRD